MQNIPQKWVQPHGLEQEVDVSMAHVEESVEMVKHHGQEHFVEVLPDIPQERV